MSRKLIPEPYSATILDAMLSARIVSRFFNISGLKMLCRSSEVMMEISPARFFNVLLTLPLRLLPLLRS